MPVYQKNNISKTIKIGVWKIAESEFELIDTFVSIGYDKEIILQTKNKQRLKQWIATRILLRDFFDDAVIVYDDLGKPSLDNGWRISISHSNNFVAIIINKNESCGIDIEKVTPKIERIKHKFLNTKDLKTITSLEHLIVYWGAKEALYKYYGKKEVLFIEHLFIHNFYEKEHTFIGEIKMANFQKEVSMVWDSIEDFVLVYTV